MNCNLEKKMINIAMHELFSLSFTNVFHKELYLLQVRLRLNDYYICMGA